MTWLPTARHPQWFAFCVIAPVLCALFLVSGFFRWSPLHCWHEEVDLHSGRVRHTWYLLYCRVSDRTEETWLSRAINTSRAKPQWRRVNTLSPGIGYSPHYSYHGALYQIEMLRRTDDLLPFEAAARREAANKLLDLWQTQGSYFKAEEHCGRSRADGLGT
jgi:hypothetical protein